MKNYRIDKNYIYISRRIPILYNYYKYNSIHFGVCK